MVAASTSLANGSVCGRDRHWAARSPTARVRRSASEQQDERTTTWAACTASGRSSARRTSRSSTPTGKRRVLGASAARAACSGSSTSTSAATASSGWRRPTTWPPATTSAGSPRYERNCSSRRASSPREELERRMAQLAGEPTRTPRRTRTPSCPLACWRALDATAAPVLASAGPAPRFAVGDRVVTRNDRTRSGHTRLPRYARGKRGRRSTRVHGCLRLPRHQRPRPGRAAPAALQRALRGRRAVGRLRRAARARLHRPLGELSGAGRLPSRSAS